MYRPCGPPSAGVLASILAGVIVVVVLSGCSSGDQFHSTSELDPDSEIVTTDEFYGTAEELARDYETPPGGKVRPEAMEPVVITVDSLESVVAFRVACQWFRYWLDSRAAGDDGDDDGELLASRKLADLTSWPVVQADGLVEFYTPIVVAVTEADDEAVETHLERNCPDVRVELPERVH
jgi:hypothetical protein